MIPMHKLTGIFILPGQMNPNVIWSDNFPFHKFLRLVVKRLGNNPICSLSKVSQLTVTRTHLDSQNELLIQILTNFRGVRNKKKIHPVFILHEIDYVKI